MTLEALFWRRQRLLTDRDTLLPLPRLRQRIACVLFLCDLNGLI